MKVRADSINEQGLTLTEDIDTSTWDMDSSDIKFVGKINLCCEFKRLNSEVLVKAKVSGRQKVQCSRCLEESLQDQTRQFYRSYNFKELGQFLEVDSDIREEILLDWPMKPLCKDDCKGLCSGCGKNLNVEECNCPKEAKAKD